MEAERSLQSRAKRTITVPPVIPRKTWNGAALMKDNWGDTARFGMFIVGNEAVPEAEWWAMGPAGVSIHAARVTARAPWARWDSERRDVVLESDLERGAAQFAAMRLSAAVVAHISSSIIGGAGWGEAIIFRVFQNLWGGKPIYTQSFPCGPAPHEMQAEGPRFVLAPR